AIAHHLREAGDAADRKACFAYSLLAGQRALRTSAFEEAFSHLQRAAGLEDVTSGDQRGELFVALGKVYRSLGHTEAAIDTWERARREYVALGDGAAVGRISVDMGMDLIYRGRVPEGEAAARQGLAAMGDLV